MNTTIYLLKTSDLKEYSTILSNVDDSLLEPAILNSQNIDIQDIIGTKLYEEILRLYDTGEITGTTQEIIDIKYLLDEYIFYTLINYALNRSLPYIQTSIANMGVVNHSNTYSSPVSKDQYNDLKNDIKNTMEYYSNNLKKFLVGFFEDYPDYSCNTDETYYNTPSSKSSYNSGMYFG